MKTKQSRLGKPSKMTGKTRQSRVVHVAHGFRQAREWEILQEIAMTPGQRQRAAKALKERFYGHDAPDVREAHSRCISLKELIRNKKAVQRPRDM